MDNKMFYCLKINHNVLSRTEELNNRLEQYGTNILTDNYLVLVCAAKKIN